MGRSQWHYAYGNNSEKDKYCIISLICEIQKQNITKPKTSLIDSEGRLLIARGRGRDGRTR